MSPSLSSLRTWRSTIYAPSSRESANVVNRAVESSASINNRLSQQQQYESSVTELRRRLARKASTFSLRRKSRRSQTYLKDLVKQAEESDNNSLATVTQEIVRVCQAGTKGVESSSASQHTHPTFEAPKLWDQALERRKGYHTSVSMSSESSPPPVPFKRLQDIASEACHSTLKSASSYVHENTAAWNTAIINNILQELVKYSTSESQPQPQYKYIVNSTIIQHAPGGDGGRRGMHAASGAYWNNEKDGMWSFKHEAAEDRGLDVVVGIIWVWIG